MNINHLFIVLICSVLTFSCNTHSEPSMKVVTRSGEVLGRFVEETQDSYIVEVQDTYPVEKNGAVIEIWKASDGKGIVYLKDFGKADAYAGPDTKSAVIGVLNYEEGNVPDTYNCLGYSKGWFTIELNNGKAYIQECLVDWDAVNTF